MAGVILMMEPEVLARLIEQQSAALVLYARQWTAAPEDVVQEAFLKLAGLRSPPANPVGWLFRVTRNGALSAARAEQRRRKHEANAAQSKQAWFQARENSPVDTQEAVLALQQLPIEQREIIVAHIWGGLTFEQIAEVVGCSSSTAHRRYGEGLAQLRERLGMTCPSKTNTMR